MQPHRQGAATSPLLIFRLPQQGLHSQILRKVHGRSLLHSQAHCYQGGQVYVRKRLQIQKAHDDDPVVRVPATVPGIEQRHLPRLPPDGRRHVAQVRRDLRLAQPDLGRRALIAAMLLKLPRSTDAREVLDGEIFGEITWTMLSPKVDGFLRVAPSSSVEVRSPLLRKVQWNHYVMTFSSNDNLLGWNETSKTRVPAARIFRVARAM